MSTLYRKYRPQTFQEVVGQEHVVTTLLNALAHKRVAHAYLFAGPRGTGKTSIARLLAKELGVSGLDVIEIDAASNRGIDEARTLKEKVQVVPVASPFKVFIIDEVHMLTKEAFNALLKTLEEPPAHAIFILATTEPTKIPDTIISRTQRFDFKKITNDKITQLLTDVAKKEEAELHEEAARIIATHSEGALRDALSLLDQLIHSNATKNITPEDVLSVLGIPSFARIQQVATYFVEKDLENGLKTIDELATLGVDFYLFLAHLVEYVRSLLLAVSRPGTEDIALSDAEAAVFRMQKEHTDAGSLLKLLGLLFRAREDMKSSPLPSLPLEIALISFSDGERVAKASVQKTEVAKEVPVAPKTEPLKEEKPLGKVEAEDTKTAEPKEVSATPKFSEEILNVEPISQKSEVRDVLNRWGEALGHVKKKNFAIGGFLRGGTPVEIIDDTLVVACKFPFHKEKIADRKNRGQIEEVLEKMFGRRMSITCVLESELTPEQRAKLESNTREQEVIITENALEMFEGRVVSE